MSRWTCTFCDWGLTTRIGVEPEAMETTAYTRYVFERGMAGDLLDLHVALAPCIVGYGEIGVILSSDGDGGNPYRSWIEMYAGDEYQDIARGAVAAGPVGGGERGDARFQIWRRPSHRRRVWKVSGRWVSMPDLSGALFPRQTGNG